MTFSLPPRSHLLWLAIDLDGTLAEQTTGPEGAGVWPIGEPITDCPNCGGSHVEKAREAARHAWKIVIHTARPWSDYEMIEKWLTLHDIPFDKIVCGKLLAAAYIDDRGISPQADRWYPSR